MRQMQQQAAMTNPAMNNLNYVRQMQLQQQYQLQQQAAWQQQLIRSMSQHNLNMPKATSVSPPAKSTNHSIASMISDAPTIINSKYTVQNYYQNNSKISKILQIFRKFEKIRL